MSDSATPRTVARQASLSMEFSRQGYWSGLPFPSPQNLPDPGIEPWSPALQADSLPLELQGSPMFSQNPEKYPCYFIRFVYMARYKEEKDNEGNT